MVMGLYTLNREYTRLPGDFDRIGKSPRRSSAEARGLSGLNP